VLLLDTFFTVVILLGHQVALRRQQDSDDTSLLAAIKQPVADATAIVAARFPCPKYVECTQYSGDARHLLSVLDPEQASSAADISQLMPTEDVSYNTFFSFLVKLVVQT
jgi:protein transport protein SEC23